MYVFVGFYSVTVKKHHNQGRLQRKHLIVGLLEVSTELVYDTQTQGHGRRQDRYDVEEVADSSHVVSTLQVESESHTRPGLGF